MSNGSRDVITPVLASMAGSLTPELQAQLMALLKVQQEAAELDIAARKEEKDRKAEAERTDKEARKQNAIAAKKSMEDTERMQKGCWHVRPDGHTNLGGQWNWEKTQITLVCGTCGLIDTDTKPNLMAKYGPQRYPKDENLGGPETTVTDNLM